MGETCCPKCGAELAEGRVVAGRKELGRENVSICRDCAEVLILSESATGLAIRAATVSEYFGLPEESQTLLRVAFELIKRPRRQSRMVRQLN
ncbi:MAG TPA: hypothetical protein VKS22_02215 [Candidatus Binataceae bacterium]|nr:hypothetical protein [Candidatus Binataceae bacterium]